MNILFYILLLSFSLSHASDLMCEKRNEVFWSRVQDRNNQGKPALLRTLNSVLSGNNPNLLLLGEEHGSPAETEMYSDIFKELIKTNGFDCMFLEWKTIAIYRKYMAWQMDEVLKIAGKDKIKVIPTDLANPSSMDIRNKAMAEEINRHFSQGSCTKGFMVIGKGHLQPTVDGGTTLQGFLNPKVISEKKINIVSRNSIEWKMNPYEDVVWKQCQESEYMISLGTTSFPIEDEFKDLPIYNETSRVLSVITNDNWTNFDALIIYR